ncbi:MAG TPA: SRPBCC family protein [Gemmatimonadaceae bacterium]|nr:SRPBCC family protein [Gemmatimonadaceae bacterium]
MTDAIIAAAHDPGDRSLPVPVARPDAGAVHVLPALAGAALLALGARRRGRAGVFSAAMGAGLLAHAFTPVLRSAVVRRGAARRSIDLDRTFIVRRSVREAFAFCANFENFPALIGALVEVEDFGDGRSRWVVRHTDGALVEWSAIVTKFVPNQVIAWESVPSSPVESRGLVRFRSLGDERTQLTVHLAYSPKRTSFDEAWRALFTTSPQHEVRRDLARAGDILERWDATAEPDPPEPMRPE